MRKEHCHVLIFHSKESVTTPQHPVHSAMAVAQRYQCMKSMRRLLLAKASMEKADTQAVECEHAVYVVSKGNELIYPIQALRALRVLEFGKSEIVDSVPSYIELLEMPAVKLFTRLPCLEAQQSEEALRSQGEALLRDLSSSDLSNIPDAGTRCSKCKSSDISFDFLQTRSADEGTTVYCTCTSCGKRWKM